MQRGPALLLAAAALAACSGQQQQSVQKSSNDAYLVTAVSAKLAGVDVDSTTDVRVSASNGTVTLSGRAHTGDERTQYENAARSVSGVTSVVDKIAIAGNYESVRAKTSDAALTVRVSAAIAGQAGVNVFQVTPSVSHGVVTLSGHVGDRAVEDAIVHTVQKVPGVHAVVNRIVIKP